MQACQDAIMNRRTALKTIALGTAGLQAALSLAEAQSKLEPVKIVALDKLGAAGTTQEFVFASAQCLLVVQKAPEKPNPQALAVKRGEESLALLGLSRTCTHEGCTIDLPDKSGVMSCSCHGSEFNVANGNVVGGPARQNLLGVKLELRGTDVWAVGWAG